MYFPYLRGRQFELLALKELLENNCIGNKITPVIEPVKYSSTLISTLASFNEKSHNIALVDNPQVGTFESEYIKAINDIKQKKMNNAFSFVISNQNIILSHILGNESLDAFSQYKLNGAKIEDLLIVATNRDIIESFKDFFLSHKTRYNLILDERIFKRTISANKILLDDKFNKLNRNADYKNNNDELFSEDHIYYKEEGFIGFSDYSIVGDEFTLSGFAPNAVAIHIVYFDNKKNLRIKHFVSDTNGDAKNPAKKFSEALEKLIKWKNSQININSFAMNKFEEHYKKGTYPGLGTIKKLSIMHHLELMSKYLDGALD